MNPSLSKRPDHLIGRLMWRVETHGAQSIAIDGIEVFTRFDSDISRTAAVRARLGLALELIDDLAPRIGAHLRRDVTGILLCRVGGTHFDVSTQMISLDLRWSMVGTVEDLAISLVHEATHARQRALGVRSFARPNFKRRMEAHAVAESIYFANRLPPGPWTMPSLADLEKEWWRPEKRANLMFEAAADAGLPLAPFRIFARFARIVGLAR